MIALRPAETVAAFYTALSQRDAGALAGLFAPGAVAHLPVGAPMLEDREAIGAWFEGLLGLFGTLEVEPESVFHSGPAAAVMWRAKGSDDRGGEAVFEGIDVLEFDADGRIEVLMAFWDPAGVIERLRT